MTGHAYLYKNTAYGLRSTGANIGASTNSRIGRYCQLNHDMSMQSARRSNLPNTRRSHTRYKRLPCNLDSMVGHLSARSESSGGGSVQKAG